MNNTTKILAAVIVLVAVVVFMFLRSGGDPTLGARTSDIITPTDSFRNYTFLNATSTSATSTNIDASTGSFGEIDRGYMVVAGAEEVTMYFSRGDASGNGNSGSSSFSVEVSPDGSTWNDYNKLISNVTNTNSQTKTRVASVSIAAGTSTTIGALDLSDDAIYAIRCIAVETTDGEHTCKASAKF